jgi:hypothetical protein
MAMKPRIVLTIVTEEGKIEFSTVKGRELPGGGVAPGPSKEQIKIAQKALLALLQSC